VGPNGHIGFHTRRHVLAQDFQYDPDGLGPLVGLLHNLGDHDLAMLGAIEILRPHYDVLVQALVVRHHETQASFHVNASHHFVIGPLQHLHHRSFPTAALIDTDHSYHRPVTMQQLAHLPGGKKKILSSFVRFEETEPIPMTDDPSRNQILFIDQAQGAAPVAYQLPISLHGVQPSAQGFQILLAV